MSEQDSGPITRTYTRCVRASVLRVCPGVRACMRVRPCVRGLRLHRFYNQFVIFFGNWCWESALIHVHLSPHPNENENENEIITIIIIIKIKIIKIIK